MNGSPRKLTCNELNSERYSEAMKKLKVRAPLMEIMHPNWTSSDDYLIMKLKEEGGDFSKIAKDLGRARIAVEQRFHRLRVVADVVKKLQAFGLSNKPYSMGSM